MKTQEKQWRTKLNDEKQWKIKKNNEKLRKTMKHSENGSISTLTANQDPLMNHPFNQE